MTRRNDTPSVASEAAQGGRATPVQATSGDGCCTAEGEPDGIVNVRAVNSRADGKAGPAKRGPGRPVKWAGARCIAGDCDRKVVSRGMCAMHYQRARNTGRAPTARPQRQVRKAPCSAPGCGAWAAVKGFCHFHYNRQIKGVSLGQPRQKRTHEPLVAPAANGGCGVLECGRPVAALNMCWGHYRRWNDGKAIFVFLRNQGGKRVSAVRFGPKAPTQRQRREVLFRFWLTEGMVTPEPTTGCLIWAGETFPNGYGKLGYSRDPWGGYAHRAALHFAGVMLNRGRKLHVRHRCDNPGCVSVQHLAYGSARENALDRERRGRSAARIDADTARAIRAAVLAGGRTTEVARQFDVSPSLVTAIRSGRSFRWAFAEAA